MEVVLVNLNVIAGYAPPLDTEEETKDSFYDDLREVVNRVPSRNTLVVAGGWNARPGPVNMGTRNILGARGVLKPTIC